ncbi:MAG: PepSY-associated TM helix domain-containing protein [Fulvimonas sp.]|nr:PepSY-associated TM helix domain-containing protein [Fulvimonas sp.]
MRLSNRTRQTFLWLHSWTGLLAGFALFIAFYAGAFTVFREDIAHWQNPPWRTTASGPASTDMLVRKLHETHPELDDFGIVLPPALPPYAYWRVEGHARYATLETIDHPSTHPPSGSLGDFLFSLHYTLGLGAGGQYLMGLVSALYGLALISGLLIHLPQLTRHLFALRPGRNLKQLWQDAHNVIGVLSLPFHMVFALTGATLCLFALVLAALNGLAFDGRLFGAYAQATALAPARAASGVPAAMLPVDTLLEKARVAAETQGVVGLHPDYLHFIHYGDRAAIVEIRGVSARTLASYGQVALEGASGRVLAVRAGRAHDANSAVTSALYALHFGTYGGRVVQAMYFLLALAGAFLFYSGNLLWIESRRKRRQAEQPRKVLLMTRATLGVCLGCCLGIALAAAATAWSARFDAASAAMPRAAFYAGLAFACLHALWRPVPYAAVELLAMCALVHVLTALGDASHTLPAWHGPWREAARTALAVDGVNLLLAAAFAALAVAVHRRARRDDSPGLWSHPV